MQLFLKNIGRIATASVEINGITVIAGENNTGKSTVGRALFSVFNSFCNIQKQIEFERVQNIENLINLMYRSLTNRYAHIFSREEISRKIVENINTYKDDAEAVKDEIVKNILQYNENFQNKLKDDSINELISLIRDGLNVPDIDIFKSVLEKKLNAEFNGQINNIFADNTGEIRLSIKDTNITVTIKDNSVENITGEIDPHTEAVYIDDPFVLDETTLFDGIGSNYLDHRSYLRMKLYRENNVNLIEEIVAGNKLENIYRRISEVCSGDIVSNKRSGLGYRRKNADKVLEVKNLSTGFKTFAILKTLLMNGSIEYNGTLILDEPEIHLHPEWQLLFAEIIVLIQKEFGVHILLNTHSPYFLNAIEVYAAKYDVDNKCKYYLASSQEDVSTIEDVTDNIEAIYSKLARPLQDLENERGRL